MQIYIRPLQRPLAVLLSLALVSSPLVQAALPEGAEANVPVKQVTLYKHGIGFFEREGSIPAGQEVRLDFKNTDMNDVLKSLTVADAAGGRVTGIRYDSNATLEQRLDKYPFRIGSGERLSAFLDGLKGAGLEIKTGDRTVTGVILSARSVNMAPGGTETAQRVVSEQVTLLLDSGDVANYDLGAITSMRLLDPRLQSQLKDYLQTLAQAKSRDKRSVYIDSAGKGSRQLHLSYIVPVAIWKSSYRLNMQSADTTLEGWAIVDNTTDEDWNSVRLSVVSGRPISFISLLDTPRYGNRQVAELAEDRAAGPQVYGGAVGGTLAGVLGGVVGGVGAPPPPPPMAKRPQTQPGAGLTMSEQMGRSDRSFLLNQSVSTVEGATGAALGELFEYNFPGPVTIHKNQSAMLPFLQDKVSARKLLIYTQNDGEHPVNAAELSNSTAKTLDGGPITVYDGGAYAGEALFETLKAGDKRLIGYAVDYGTRITTAFDSGSNVVREIAAANGVLRLRYAQHQVRAYTIKNVDTKPKTLIVQQEGINDYSVLSPQPTERTATAYRFQVQVAAGATQQLKVEQERVYWEGTSVSDSANDFLVSILENKQLSAAGRQQLQTIIDIRTRLAETQAALEGTKGQIGELTNDQNRLRQNIDSLNRVKGQEDQVRQYSSQLAANEASLAKLRDQYSAGAQRKTALEGELSAAISKLSF
ncbi:MAG TPA: DUF4139 domain-containing protein [Bryobacteraceae bacterium]|nr:DUF4139 domain-containing protein [Bryobacteraceae bacterium]